MFTVNTMLSATAPEIHKKHNCTRACVYVRVKGYREIYFQNQNLRQVDFSACTDITFHIIFRVCIFFKQ